MGRANLSVHFAPLRLEGLQLRLGLIEHVKGRTADATVQSFPCMLVLRFQPIRLLN